MLLRLQQISQSVAASTSPIDLLCIGNLVAGRYKYMADLRVLEATATSSGPECFSPATPLITRAWQQSLEDHPDKEFASQA